MKREHLGVLPQDDPVHAFLVEEVLGERRNV